MVAHSLIAALCIGPPACPLNNRYDSRRTITIMNWRKALLHKTRTPYMSTPASPGTVPGLRERMASFLFSVAWTTGQLETSK